MSKDATFEEGGEQPLRLIAEDGDDITIVSSLIQDAVFTAGDMTWDKNLHRFAILINRFRWEDQQAAERRGRKYERVRTMLVINDVVNVQSQGVDRADPEVILSVLSISAEKNKDGSGRVIVTLAGDGAIAADVEVVDVLLKDVTRPYLAVSRSAPEHPE